MQTYIDMEVLMESIQNAAMRRGLFVTYTPRLYQWAVINPKAEGKIVGRHPQLEKIFDILDKHPIRVMP